jgi:hypothetical protein
MSKEISAEQLFENIALDNRLITKFQLEKAKKALGDREANDDANLGDVFVDMGFITDRQLNSIKSAQNYRLTRNTDKRFGRQAVRMKLVKATVVQGLLKGQKEIYEKSGKTSTLAQILVSEGEMSKKDVRAVKDELAQHENLKVSGREKEASDNDRHFVECPNCQQKLLIRPHNFERTVKCSGCATRFKASNPGGRQTDDFDVPIVADLDEEDEDVIDIEEIELEEAEQKALKSASEKPINDDIFDGLPDDEDPGDLNSKSKSQGLDDDLDGLDDDLDGLDDDLDGLDDLDDDALRSDLVDLDDDIDIDDLDDDDLSSEDEIDFDDDMLTSDVLTSDSAPEDDFDDLDEDFLEDLDDEEVEDISDVDSEATSEVESLPSGSSGSGDLGHLDTMGSGGLVPEVGALLGDSGVMDASWATNAFDDRPIGARSEVDLYDMEVEQLVPLENPADVTQLIEPIDLRAKTTGADIPGASVLDDDDDLFDELDEEGILSPVGDDAEGTGFGSLKDRTISAMPVATSSPELDSELQRVPALGTLLEDLPDEDIDDELKDLKTPLGLPPALKHFTSMDVDALADEKSIDELFPDSAILNRTNGTAPTESKEAESEEKMHAPNPFEGPVPPSRFSTPASPEPLVPVVYTLPEGEDSEEDVNAKTSRIGLDSFKLEQASKIVETNEKAVEDKPESFAETVAKQVTAVDAAPAESAPASGTEAKAPQYSEEKLQKAFDKAMKVAFKAFMDELAMK